MGYGVTSLIGRTISPGSDVVDFGVYSLDLTHPNVEAGSLSLDVTRKISAVAVGLGTDGSLLNGFDPALHVFENTAGKDAVIYFQPIAYNDDSNFVGGVHNSKIEFEAEAGVLYDFIIEDSAGSISKPMPYYFERSIDDAGDSTDTAKYIGELTNVVLNDFVGLSDQMDSYSFSVSKTSNFSLKLDNLQADVRVTVAGQNGGVDSSVYTAGSSKTLNTSLEAGYYTVRLDCYNNSVDAVLAGQKVATNYRLSMSTSQSPTVSFSQGTYQVSEGQVGKLTLVRTGDLSKISEVQLTTAGGIASNTDYQSVGYPRNIRFEAGAATATVLVPINEDSLYETVETIKFNITGVSNAVAASSATMKIIDNDPLLGNAANNTLIGDSRNDVICGKGGTDRLAGMGGSDKFVFDIGSAYNQKIMGIDVIIDFVRGVDTIVLDRSTFTKLSGSALQAFQFAVVKDATAASKAGAMITYVQSTGGLYYNQNGASAGFGMGGQFADLTNGLALSRANITVQA